MKIKFSGQADLQVLFYEKNAKQIPALLKKQALFKGDCGEIFTYIINDRTQILCGIGDKTSTDYFKFLKTGVQVAKKLKKIKSSSAQIDFEGLHAQQAFFACEGILLELDYQYSLKKDTTQLFIKELIFSHIQPDFVQKAQHIAASRNLVRKLVDMPANLLTTDSFVEQIRDALKEIPCQHTVWDEKKLEKEDMNGLLTVGGGSSHPPYLVQIHYKPAKASRKVTLIGKGITFDSGGLSIKPTDGMLDMKTDMAGAATVLGLIIGTYKLSLPIEIHALLPIAENLISSKSYRIGDVITYKNGKSVEITNTDAEGRLILADALCLTHAIESDLMIDLATLTGACMVALGTDIYGVFSDNEKLARNFSDFINLHTSERAWPLPLYEKYKEHLKSALADFKNTGKRFGGAISAALFLKEFVPQNRKWLHLDIAGPAYDDGIGLFDSLATAIPLESVLLYLEKMDY